MRTSMLSVPACTLLLASAATAQWSDNFDTYNIGTVTGQGGWEEWTTGAEAYVTTTQFRSAPNSLAIGQATPTGTLESDVVQQYYNTNMAAYSTGHWVYTAWQYIPSSMTGTTYFILLNTYNIGGPYNWSVQVEFDAQTGDVEIDAGASNNGNTAIILDQWVRLTVHIDLDNDTCQFYYDDKPLGPEYQWSGGVFGQGGGNQWLGAVDLYGNTATDCYYDDMEARYYGYELIGRNPPSSVGPIQFTELLSATITNGAWITQFDGLPDAPFFHVVSTNRTTSTLGTLPIDLTPFGLTGMCAYVNTESVLFQLGTPTGTTFQGQFAVTIGGPQLLGTNLYQQLLYLDNGLNPAGAGMSDAYGTRITM